MAKNRVVNLIKVKVRAVVVVRGSDYHPPKIK